ncbi:MAG: DUF5362 family protein [Myxococcota bacterium]
MAQPYGAPHAYAQPHPGMAGAAGGGFLSPTGVSNAKSLKTWMKFFGIVQIVLGAIYCLSIVGIIIGWLPILLGYWLVKAANGIEAYASTGQIAPLETGIGALRAHYLTLGILTIIWLILTLLWILLYIIMGAAMFAGLAAAAP